MINVILPEPKFIQEDMFRTIVYRKQIKEVTPQVTPQVTEQVTVDNEFQSIFGNDAEEFGKIAERIRKDCNGYIFAN